MKDKETKDLYRKGSFRFIDSLLLFLIIPILILYGLYVRFFEWREEFKRK